jgi:hypothetical protein
MNINAVCDNFNKDFLNTNNQENTVIYGTLKSFQFDTLLDSFTEGKFRARRYDILIVDEID